MNASMLLAQGLALLAFVIHTWVGDRELQALKPKETTAKVFETWMQVRAGWHLVSWDLLLATVGLTLLTWTDWLTPAIVYLQLLTLYFAGAGTVWLLVVLCSPAAPNKLWRLGQWMLL